MFWRRAEEQHDKHGEEQHDKSSGYRLFVCQRARTNDMMKPLVPTSFGKLELRLR